MRLSARVGDRTAEVEVRGRDGRYTVVVDGETLDVDVAETGPRFASLIVDGRSHEMGIERRPEGYRVHGRDGTVTVTLFEASSNDGLRRDRVSGPERLVAPMPGRVVRLLATEGQEVEVGEGLVVIEAMKMENELKALRKGRVSEVAVQEGQAVDAGALLVVVA
jgi:biotin carboxyl carrier protein